MTSEQREVLVFRDGTGNYYVVPRMDFEEYRVTEEQKARVEQMIGENDVTGFGGPLLSLGIVIPPVSNLGKQQSEGGRQESSNFRW